MTVSKGVLFNIVGGENLSLFEVNEAAEVIRKAVDPEANIIFGVAQDPAMDKEVRITLIATGFVSPNGLDENGNDEEDMNKLLRGLKSSEDDLDVPSFLRRPLALHRRQTIIPSKTTKSPSREY